MSYVPIRTQVLTLNGKTAGGSFVVPAGWSIRDIMVFNTTANAITDGLKFGTSAGGTDVVSARSVTANAFTFVPDANLAKRVFSTTVDQTIYFDAVTAWNSANVNIAVHLAKVF